MASGVLDDVAALLNEYITPGLVGLEGPPYAGKTTMMHRLATEHGFKAVPEHLDFEPSLLALAHAPWPEDVEGMLARQHEFLRVEVARGRMAMAAADRGAVMDRTIISVVGYLYARTIHRPDHADVVRRFLDACAERLEREARSQRAQLVQRRHGPDVAGHFLNERVERAQRHQLGRDQATRRIDAGAIVWARPEVAVGEHQHRQDEPAAFLYEDRLVGPDVELRAQQASTARDRPPSCRVGHETASRAAGAMGRSVIRVEGAVTTICTSAWRPANRSRMASPVNQSTA